MSRLDSVIRRLEAQRACLEHAALLVGTLPGPVLEFGLGQGRTYDHLREILPGREIFVFEREIADGVGGAEGMPDNGHLILGDVRETLPHIAGRFSGAVPLIHSDIGTGDARSNGKLAHFLAAFLPDLLRPGGVVVSDQDLMHDAAVPVALPDGVRPGRYFMYRAGPDRHFRSSTTGT